MAGVVEGLAPKERRLPPQECLRVWAGLGWERAMDEKKKDKDLDLGKEMEK